jgi:16S rRNA (guanine966-N2)-methyltransferase
MNKSAAAKSLPNRLRIIGGSWRGTRLQFPAVAAIRPTPDRVRETLFNWLQGVVSGARCLDLYAGSGALGLEALSRGAREVVFVDQEPAVGAYLRGTLQRLKTTAGRVEVADAEHFLRQPPEPFDLVFLDPPFARNLLGPICLRLEQARWLNDHAYIYLECAADTGLPVLPPGWQLWRSKQAGQVGYHLARRIAAPAPTTERP